MIRFQSTRRGGAAGLVLFLIFGVVFLIFGMKIYSSQQTFTKTGIAAKATVINNQSQIFRLRYLQAGS